MGTSITVPKHIESRFSRRAPKDGFLPVHLLPVPAQKLPQMDNAKSQQDKSKLTIPYNINKLYLKSIEPKQRSRERGQILQNKEVEMKKVPLTSRDANKNEGRQALDQEGQSSIWNSLSREAKVNFKQVSNRRKMSKNYKSISVQDGHELDFKDIKIENKKEDASLEHKQINSEYYSEPTQVQKPKIKLKSLYREEEIKDKKKRVRLYPENAENIYE